MTTRNQTQRRAAATPAAGKVTYTATSSAKPGIGFSMRIAHDCCGADCSVR
jgi:hypothetical protein